jgi:hypothetical protein
MRITTTNQKIEFPGAKPACTLAKLLLSAAMVPALCLLASVWLNQPAQAQATATTSDYAAWPLLLPRFPSTGGGGVMIEGYDPVVANGKCTTDFQAVVPTGEIYRSEVSFDAVPIQGGILCTNGQWRAKDGSNSGTTPYEVFIKDGVRRGKP